jgi:hypothetical protein
MQDIDLMDLRMSSKMWEKRGLVPMGKMIEHTSMYGTDLADDENAESMMKMFVNLPAEVITLGVSKIHEEFSKFFCAEYFEGTLEEKDSPLAALHGIQKCFIIIQNRFVQATEELSRSVIGIASQRPAPQTDFSGTRACNRNENSVNAIDQFPAYQQSPGGNHKEVLALPNS